MERFWEPDIEGDETSLLQWFDDSREESRRHHEEDDESYNLARVASLVVSKSIFGAHEIEHARRHAVSECRGNHELVAVRLKAGRNVRWLVGGKFEKK